LGSRVHCDISNNEISGGYQLFAGLTSASFEAPTTARKLSVVSKARTVSQVHQNNRLRSVVKKPGSPVNYALVDGFAGSLMVLP
jgi:hypothetical protein